MSIDKDLQAIMTRDMDYAINQISASLTHIDDEELDPAITGTKGEQTNTDDSELAGFYANKNLEILFKKASFTDNDIDIPSVGTKLTIDGSDYRIEDKGDSQDEISIRLVLRDD